MERNRSAEMNFARTAAIQSAFSPSSYCHDSCIVREHCESTVENCPSTMGQDTQCLATKIDCDDNVVGDSTRIALGGQIKCASNFLSIKERKQSKTYGPEVHLHTGQVLERER